MNQFRISNDALTDDNWLESVATALVEQGYGIFPDCISETLISALATEAEALWDQGEYRKARIGRGPNEVLHPEIRTDRILWLNENEASPAQSVWLAGMEALKVGLNRRLFLGLDSYEGHLAIYPAGGFYKPHLDCHQGDSPRVVSVILYLNDTWEPTDGGQLRLYLDRELGVAGPFVDVAPHAGTVVVFLSADYWHEVLPAHAPRISLTGWFRTRGILPLTVL